MIQACREDIAESIKLKRRLEGYRLGAYSGGCGPSADELQPRRHLAQKKKVAQFCKELYAYVESGDELHFVNLRASWMKSLLTDMILSEKQAEWKKELLPLLGNQILRNASPRKEAHEAAKFQHSLKIVKSCRNSFHVIDQKLVRRFSSGVPKTEKQMKARRRRRSAFIVSRCLEPLMKNEARVFELASQTSMRIFFEE